MSTTIAQCSPLRAFGLWIAWVDQIQREPLLQTQGIKPRAAIPPVFKKLLLLVFITDSPLGNMTSPAVGHASDLKASIGVALIAELGFIGVAIHALILQAHVVCFAVSCHIGSKAIANHPGSPVVEHLHMTGAHLRFGQDALLDCHLLNDGVSSFSSGREPPCHVVPEGQGEKTYKIANPMRTYRAS